MKLKFLILALFLSCIGNAYCQTVNDVPFSELDADYIEIVGISKLLSTKVNVSIQFGQHDKVFSSKDTMIKDKEGKLKTFNSMIDAMNFMSENGYKFVAAYVVTISNQNVYHYLMENRNLE